MRGEYVIKVDGEEVARAENLITTAGQKAIAAYLAGIIPEWAGSLAIGTGTTAAALADTSLVMEFDREPVTAKAVLYGGGASGKHRIVCKTTIPAQVAGTITELGIYSISGGVSGAAQSVMLSGLYDDDWEVYSGGAWTDIATTPEIVYTKIGADSTTLTTSGTTTKYRLNTGGSDFSMYTASDKFTFAAYYTVGTVSGITIKFYTDDTNYYSYAPTVSTFIGAAVNTYTISSYTKSLFTATGSPSWSSITAIGIDVASGGAATMHIDGIRVDDSDSSDSDLALVSRAVLPSAKIKSAGSEMDIEYYLDV